MMHWNPSFKRTTCLNLSHTRIFSREISSQPRKQLESISVTAKETNEPSNSLSAPITDRFGMAQTQGLRTENDGVTVSPNSYLPS